MGELDGGSFRRGRTWHAPGGGRHGAPAHNPFSAADPPPESRMTHPPDSITAQWRATRQALVRACASACHKPFFLRGPKIDEAHPGL